jgi:ribosomal-protein-alanine N-acetyltransferase
MNLTTRRLQLREFVEEDWVEVLAYQSDPRYLRFYDWAQRTEADVRDFVGRFLDWQAEAPRLKFQLAITQGEAGRLIGNSGVRLARAGAREAELGYELSPAYWGQGYATEAAEAMMSFGFETLGLHRICAYTVAENVASQRVMERLGMCREGRLRENRWFKGHWRDTLVYGILEDDWQAAGQR